MAGALATEVLDGALAPLDALVDLLVVLAACLAQRGCVEKGADLVDLGGIHLERGYAAA